MPIIKISDLHPTGFELFSDSESYMNELSDSELGVVSGGTHPATPFISAASVVLQRTSQAATRYTPELVRLSDKALNAPTAIALCGDLTTLLG